MAIYIYCFPFVKISKIGWCILSQSALLEGYLFKLLLKSSGFCANQYLKFLGEVLLPFPFFLNFGNLPGLGQTLSNFIVLIETKELKNCLYCLHPYLMMFNNISGQLRYFFGRVSLCQVIRYCSSFFFFFHK